ncbi:MAG: zinc-ribbon domain-containing protein [Proteobacteria bacterium]|nr:zinc-ribbon domain-containing protein [Pseudomonadota bacterium]
MILSCSACSTRFLVDPALLSPEGRMVRCAKCGHRWKQTPSDDWPRTRPRMRPRIRWRIRPRTPRRRWKPGHGRSPRGPICRPFPASPPGAAALWDGWRWRRW